MGHRQAQTSPFQARSYVILGTADEPRWPAEGRRLAYHLSRITYRFPAAEDTEEAMQMEPQMDADER